MQLEVLERDAESGYSRVVTPGGTEGWVLSRYLMREASAREQLETLTGQLTNASTLGESLDTQLMAVKNQYDSSTRKIASLEREKSELEGELAEIRRTAANVLGINAQNAQLVDEKASAEILVGTLEQENRRLGSQSTRYWFMSGGLLLLVGIILGIWLPRIRRPRRSGYDRF